MTTEEVFAAGGAVGPAIDNWILLDHPLAVMDAGGLNIESMLLGGNSFDGLAPWAPENLQPSSAVQLQEMLMALLGANGFSMSGALAVIEQYDIDNYLKDSNGDPYYRAKLAQIDGDLAVLCPV